MSMSMREGAEKDNKDEAEIHNFPHRFLTLEYRIYRKRIQNNAIKIQSHINRCRFA